MRLDTTAAIITPERVRFRYRVAGPGRRAAAWAVDAVIQALVLMFGGAIVAALSMIGFEGIGLGGFMVMLFTVQWFYGAFFETMLAGRTPGKLIVGLRVVTLEGAPAEVRQFVLRNLMNGADFLPLLFGVGVLVMTWDGSNRRIGDRVAGTVVVDEQAMAMGEGVVIDPPIQDEERRMLPAAMPLSIEEVRAIEDFLRRRDRFGDARARELASVLADPIRSAHQLAIDDPVRVLVLAWARATGRDRALD